MSSPVDSAAHYDGHVAPFTIPYTEAVLNEVQRHLGNRNGIDRFRVLDHGAGTGAVTCGVLDLDARTEVVAVDPSASMLARLRTKALEREVNFSEVDEPSRLRIVEGLVADLTDGSGGVDDFDAVTSSLVFMFVTDPLDELSRLAERTRPGGLLALTVLSGPDQDLPFAAYWSAVHALVPGTAAAPAYPHFRHANPEPLVSAAEQSGWCDVSVSAIESFRELDSEGLWAWVGGALGVLNLDGTYRDEPLPPELEYELRAEMSRYIDPFAMGGTETAATAHDARPGMQTRKSEVRFRLPVHGWLVTATRCPSAQSTTT